MRNRAESSSVPDWARTRGFQPRLAILVLFAAAAFAEPALPPELKGVDVQEKTGQQLDLNLTFTAENGYPVRLSEFFHKDRPVILNLVYYTCPMLCNLVLNGQTSALKEIPGTPGRDFEIVTVSIDPADTFDVAQKKRASYLESYGRASSGWHFLTDTEESNAKRLADQAGFHYRYDAATKQYAHPAAIMILTPEGRLSRYLYGIRFNPRDLRLALAEASQSRFTFSADRLLLFCFHYDPQARGYVLFATNFMRMGGLFTVLAITALLFRQWRKEAWRV